MGLSHSGPPELYAAVQQAIDMARANGRTIFHEGIGFDSSRKPTTSQVRQALDTLLTVLHTNWERPLQQGYVSETHSYRLPEDAVCADVHVVELAEFCVQHRLFEHVKPRQVLACLQGTCNDREVIRKIDEVFIARRNMHTLVEIIRHSGDSLVLYGEAHIGGLKRWLVKFEDWECLNQDSYYTLQ